MAGEIALRVLALPLTGDPQTVPPVGVWERSISATKGCGYDVAAPAPVLVVNPREIRVVDPFNPAKQCIGWIPPGLPEGTYRSAVVFLYPGGVEGPRILGRNFQIGSGGDPGPVPDPCAGQVILDLGDWTRSVPVGGLARVQFSLLRSQDAITQLSLHIDASPIDVMFGTDLRKVSGAYFKMPPTPGRYTLRVVALTAGGCLGGSDRPFSVDVV